MTTRRSAPGFVCAAPLQTASRSTSPCVAPLGRRAVQFRVRSVPKACAQGRADDSGSNYLQVTASGAIRSLLTRRAVRTIAYYFREMHDAPSHKWLLGFDNFQERVDSNQFHDDGAFLYNMIRAQNVNCTFEIGHPRGYFKKQYKFTIEPYKVANRVISAREHLAQEWANDLGCIALENKEIERMCLERAFEPDEKKLQAVRGRIFDFDCTASDQTPLRYRNYKKLTMLVTQQAIARLDLELRDTSNYDYMFFRSFVQRSQPLESDESFILDLMRQTPETRMNPTHEISPRELARKLLDMRQKVAEEYIALMHAVPQEHALWSRKRLEASLALSTGAYGEDYAPNKTDRVDMSEEDSNFPTKIDSTNTN